MNTSLQQATYFGCDFSATSSHFWRINRLCIRSLHSCCKTTSSELFPFFWAWDYRSHWARFRTPVLLLADTRSCQATLKWHIKWNQVRDGGIPLLLGRPPILAITRTWSGIRDMCQSSFVSGRVLPHCKENRAYCGIEASYVTIRTMSVFHDSVYRRFLE